MASTPPKTKIPKMAKTFEDNIRKNRGQINNSINYAQWKESQKEINRARPVYERSLDVDHRNVALWLQYAEMEMNALATSASKEKNFSETLNCINKAIDLCPKNDEIVFSLYDIRGTIHYASKKPKISREAYSDWMKAYSLNPEDEDVKRNLSIYLFKIANKCYRKKEYKNAFIKAREALEFDNRNDEAHALIEYLKKKHSEIFLDEEILITLQEQQMELVTN